LLADSLWKLEREDAMSISVPTSCTNPECLEPSVRAIHCSSQKVAIDAVDTASVYSHFITYRCSRCGHTWAAQQYSSRANIWPTGDKVVTTREAETTGHESRERLRATS
jgi:hypothetical protein